MYAVYDHFPFAIVHIGPSGDFLDGALAADAGVVDEDADADAWCVNIHVNIYEILASPPTVRSLGSPERDQFGRLLYAFEVSHPALMGPHTVTMQYWPEYRSAIVNAWGSFEHINRLGSAAIRYVIGRFRAEIPNLDSLKGVRETGARAGH